MDFHPLYKTIIYLLKYQKRVKKVMIRMTEFFSNESAFTFICNQISALFLSLFSPILLILLVAIPFLPVILLAAACTDICSLFKRLIYVREPKLP